MASWSISRHPDWDQLYLDGHTAREIAELYERPVATIHYHLKRRLDFEPDFKTVHEVALAQRRVGHVSNNWYQKLRDLIEFLSVNGRLPRTTGPRSELVLHQWLAEQRKLFNAHRLPPEKISFLEPIHGWQENPRQRELDDLWRSRFAQVCAFAQQTGALPKYRTAATNYEKTLGTWLHNQHQSRTSGTLLPWREDSLDQKIPGWRSRS